MKSARTSIASVLDGYRQAVMLSLLIMVLMAPSWSQARTSRHSCVNLFLEPAPIGTVSPARGKDIRAAFDVIDSTVREFRGTDQFISPRAWRKRTGPTQLTALDLPKDVGGLEWPAAKMVKVFEHAGTYNLNFRDVIGGAHARALLSSQEPEVREIAKTVARGDGYLAIAITEEEAGSNMRSMASRSTRVPGGYEITGAKFFNARMANASHVIIFTQSADLPDGKLNVFVLPIDYPGLSFRQVEAHGLKGNSFGGVSFDRVFVPEKFRIGREGDGGRIFNQHFMYWRLMMAAAAVGTAWEADTLPTELHPRG